MSENRSKRGEVNPFLAMDVMREANAMEVAGASVIHMEVGQPAAPAPSQVLEEAAFWLKKGRLGYTDALGIPARKFENAWTDQAIV
ncbi:MAG: hypothetical protein AAFW47_01735, partial [Pseudomonadota bacterium]